MKVEQNAHLYSDEIKMDINNLPPEVEILYDKLLDNLEKKREQNFEPQFEQ